MSGDGSAVFDRLGLTEYEETALRELLSLGKTTAPNLAEATDIPKARIYGVLESLSDRGFVEVIPGRPKEYQPKPPEAILDRAVENHRQDYESFAAAIDDRREDFLAEFRPRYEGANEDVTPTEELFHVVDVGEPSERETRRLYHDAAEEVNVVTKSFEYFDSVEPAFADALDRGVDVSVLMLVPEFLSTEPRDEPAIQRETVARIREDYPAVEIRFSTGKLPFRGHVADPSPDYETGSAILLVEEEDVPNHMRQAAITDNGAFVAGLKRYFDLIWDHESAADCGLSTD
ncbi:sugar-specific transcriptional regulator [Halosimplex carlsbadense 2-9-1]|uniref:Sugar-specific transcriptional regulator n=1 Tax=Halosimplex carlsbadense 2-9-1 TaxID=797114 RepID=M0CPV2_9EURY|nr:helix-turn-helix domain-containing protein [Halosimplex carlsbadense]ELZ24417.1 sugar-specific transcriptional regulator [Halosimplex carlsbadense 2-9-1]